MSLNLKKAGFAGLAIGTFLLSFASSAHATLILELQRVNDSTAILTGTGTFDSADLTTSLTLEGATTTGNGVSESSIGNFAVVQPLGSMSVLNGTTDLRMSFGPYIFSGNLPSGSETITLDSESWAAVGSHGDLTAGAGTWKIVAPAIPEPGTVALVILGLAGLRLGRRRQTP